MKKGRKRVLVIAAAAAVGIGVLSINSALPVSQASAGEIREISGQDFKICQSFNFTTGDYRDTVLNVVADTSSCQDLTELYGKIQDFHTALNGESDKLTINLYNSAEDISGNICVGTEVYYRGETR